MSTQKIGERRARKIRAINAEVPLVEFVEKINSGEINDFETADLDLTQWKTGPSVQPLKAEIDHCGFTIKQLVKNGRKTWYGK